MRYTIAKGGNVMTMIYNVNDLISRGWKLQGGICVYEDEPGSQFFYQALFRYTDGGDSDI